MCSVVLIDTHAMVVPPMTASTSSASPSCRQTPQWPCPKAQARSSTMAHSTSRRLQRTSTTQSLPSALRLWWGQRQGAAVRARVVGARARAAARLYCIQPRVGVYAAADGARRGLTVVGEGRLLEHLSLARHVHVSLATCADVVYQRRGWSLLRADEALLPCGLAVVTHHIDRRARHGEPQGRPDNPLHGRLGGMTLGMTSAASPSASTSRVPSSRKMNQQRCESL